MTKVHLSQNKIDELKKEMEALQKAVHKHYAQDAEEGTMQYSFNDAANSEIQIKPKRKRLAQIRQILKEATVLPDKVQSEKIVLGSYVELLNDDGKIQKLRIVDPVEASPTEGLLSMESPLGKMILNKMPKDEISINKRTFKIVKIY